MNVPAGWFACNRTYTFRVFVMQADWQLADGHQTQNVTPHSTPFDVVMPACPTPPGVALTPSFGTPTSTADGFTVQISNYDALFTWAGTATASGVVVISGSGLVTVSGVAARTSSTATITTERSGYSGGSATVTAASQCDPGVVCVVGDTGPGGGIVFYVQASGTFACGATLASTCKYLEVAPNTWSGGSADPTKLWAVVAHQSSDIATIANDSSAYNNALGIGLGYTNSLAIVGQGNDTTTAAGAAREYGGGSQSDWYLPTTAELNLLCQWARNVAQDVITPCTGGSLNTGTGASGGFSTGTYWSSSERVTVVAWLQSFSGGPQFNINKDYPYYVRPVRAFGGTLACADGGVCAVGDTGPGGGVVYILSTTSGNTTGLTFEAARNDWDGAAPDGTARWCSASTVSIAGLGTAIGTGSSNSATIATTCASTGALDAAEYVRGKTIGGKTDWFLPSRDEALAIYTQRSVFIGNYAINELSLDTARYLTSTQGANVVNALGVFLQGSSSPGDSGDFSKNFNFSVRPVRSFTAAT